MRLLNRILIFVKFNAQGYVDIDLENFVVQERSRQDN